MGRGLSFKAMIMQWGPIPPSGGPHRDRYLDVNGREALRIADESYAAALAVLNSLTVTLPTIHTPLVTEDDVLRREVQRQKRTEWLALSATVDQEMLDAAEPVIRRSEAAAVAALNYLEDHDLAEVAHSAIHRAAFIRRGLYGCPIVLRDDEEFWTDCSVSMSHLRAGMSPGLISDFECSICRRLVEDCDHDMGDVYDRTASRVGGKCSVCHESECEHVVGKTYPTIAQATARNVILEEGSIVARPRYPQARMVEKSIDLGPVGDDPLVRQAAQRKVLDCDDCLGPCMGFNDMLTWKDRPGSCAGAGDEYYEVDVRR